MGKSRSVVYNYHQDWSGKRFRHLLDYYEDGRLRRTENGIYVPFGYWASTPDDNEDPTWMGFDFYINWWDSPLFNGSVEAFIQTYAGLNHTEISSRSEIITEFKKQFLKFIKIDSPESSNAEIPKFDGRYTPRAYYMKSVKGLSNIIEAGDSSKPKQFVKYGTDLIELSFHEDVAQNLGYLASLYKALSWSRINGKQVIPDNLLRFDVTLVVTEARKMNRLVYDESKRTVEVYADNISNYEYTIYECQFFFPTLPHGDEIKNSTPNHVDDYIVKMSYKYSTLKFNRLTNDLVNVPNKIEFPIDNSQIDVLKINPRKTNNNTLRPNSSASSPNSTPEFPNNQNNATESARNVTAQARNTANNPVNNLATNNLAATTTTNTTGTNDAGGNTGTTTTPGGNLGAPGSGVLANSGFQDLNTGLLTGGLNTNNVQVPFLNTSNVGGDPVNTNGGRAITATIAAQKKIIFSIKKQEKIEDSPLKDVPLDDGGILGEANRNESETNIAERLKNLNSNTPQIMTPVDEGEEILGDQLTTSSNALSDTNPNNISDRLKNLKPNTPQIMTPVDEGVSGDQLNSASSAFSDRNSGARQTLANLQRIGSNAADRAAQSAQNLRQMPKNKTLNSINNFLNQSIVGQSPTLSKVGNRLLSRGRQQLRTEIFRQASLLDRSLANIRFR